MKRLGDRASTGVLRRLTIPRMKGIVKESMYAVYCDSDDCKQTGNSKREIRLWGPSSTEPRVHLIVCPYCGKTIERQVNLEKVLRVTTG